MKKLKNGKLVDMTADEVAQLSADRAAFQMEITSYKTKRKAEYADLAEQFDMLYHDTVNGTTTWVDHITSVKQKYPKS